MAYTHTFELKFNGNTYNGEIELAESGHRGWVSDTELKGMAGNTEDELVQIFDALGRLYAAYGGLNKFEVNIKV